VQVRGCETGVISISCVLSTKKELRLGVSITKLVNTIALDVTSVVTFGISPGNSLGC